MKRTFISTAVLAALALPAPATFAADDAESADDAVVVVVGSRSQKTRTAADTTVPVDVLSSDDLTAMANTADLTDNLKALIPSYTATPATGDGSAFIRPTSLRGTASDQTLVLVDGKRRHRSALVQFFAPAAGNGAHGVDIAMIPAIALERVEVLRDGASSQYGSDAIAGVINFVTKTANSGGMFQVQYGQFFEGEQSFRIAANKGMAIGENGYLNISFDTNDNEALSRGVQRPDAQALIDAGAVGVGADSPFGDEPLVQTWGRPETSGTRFFLTAGTELAGGQELYSRFGYADTTGRYRFFYRSPTHGTLTTLAGLGYTGDLMNTGFTPYLDGDQTDMSFVAGMKGEFDNGTYYDVSLSMGSNELDYFLNNTINQSLGLTAGFEVPQMDFDVGGYKQEEVMFNVDFSKMISDSTSLAYGFEWREESYTAIAGESGSYTGAGASGMKGISPQDAGEFTRDNTALYVDLEQDVSETAIVQYALRYEDFSDFGTTINGKIAGKFDISSTTAIRGALSTGFHAPTPGQANVRTTITTFDGVTGLQVDEGLIPSTDPRAVAAGGSELTEEKARNISLGFTTELGDKTTLTVDAYQISVDDRIYRTGDVTAFDGSSISFYTNAIDVEHTGFDIVLSSEFDWSADVSTNVSFAFNHNTTDVVNQKEIETLVDPIAMTYALVSPVSDGNVEDIENNYPENRFVLTTNTNLSDKVNLMVRVNFYGEHYDERGRINDAVNPSALIDAIYFFDAELSYQVNDDATVKFGVVNMADEYPNELDAPYSNRMSVGLPYPRRSAANYEGGSWYLGVNYTF
ncbi:MAG: TonB-dependent receptor [Gammaproteobacteria bacterium]|nr:TonB-dependent receptor [Gammaproteobacteria bacterium]